MGKHKRPRSGSGDGSSKKASTGGGGVGSSSSSSSAGSKPAAQGGSTGGRFATAGGHIVHTTPRSWTVSVALPGSVIGERVLLPSPPLFPPLLPPPPPPFQPATRTSSSGRSSLVKSPVPSRYTRLTRWSSTTTNPARVQAERMPSTGVPVARSAREIPTFSWHGFFSTWRRRTTCEERFSHRRAPAPIQDLSGNGDNLGRAHPLLSIICPVACPDFGLTPLAIVYSAHPCCCSSRHPCS